MAIARKQVPRLDSIYNAKWKNEGVKMYGVLTETKDLEQWKKFIKDKNLGNWINVYETDAQRKIIQDSKQASYKQLYDVIQTPTLYLLDKDKKIIAKKLTMEQMDEVLDAKIKSQSAKTATEVVKRLLSIILIFK